MELSKEALEKLLELRSGATGFFSVECMQLELLGLVESGQSRYAHWVKITDEGKRLVSSLPGSPAGAAPMGGYSYRSAALRKRDDAASKREEIPANTPPAVALQVGEASSMPPQQRDGVGISFSPLRLPDKAESVAVAPSVKDLVSKVTATVIQRYKRGTGRKVVESPSRDAGVPQRTRVRQQRSRNR